MKDILTPFMNIEDIPVFAANCKFGSTPMRYGKFHPGILRAQMKLLEEINSKLQIEE